MTRAGLLLYDDLRKLVLPAGSHGVEPWLLDQVHGTLEETPVAQTALAEDRVVVVSDDLARQIPAAVRGARRASPPSPAPRCRPAGAGSA